MKLTEKELNYILSECLKRSLNEAGMQPMGNSMNARMNTNANRTQVNPIEAAAGGLINGINRFRNSELAKGLSAAAVGAMSGLSAIWSADVTGIEAVRTLGQVGVGAGIAAAVGGIALSVHRKYQLRKKKMPKNKLQAFKLACDAHDEYIKCITNARKVYASLINALKQYNQAVPYWNQNKPDNEEELKPLTYQELFSVVLKQSNEFDVEQQGVSGAVKGKSQEELRGLHMEGILKENNGNMWANKKPLEAQKSLGEMTGIYHAAYKLTYEWKVYILALMKKFDFTLEEIKSKKLNGSRIGAALTRGENGEVDANSIANDSTYTSLTLIDDYYVWVNKETNSQHIYTIWEADNEEYYAVFKNDITGITLNKGMTVNVPEIKKLYQGNAVINYNVKNVYAQCLKPEAFSSSVAQSEEDNANQFKW